MNILLKTKLNNLKKLSKLNQVSLLKHLGDNIIRTLLIQSHNSYSGVNITDVVCDVFSDNDGYLNTVDTGNTTATFSSNYFTNGNLILNINDTSNNNFILTILTDIDDSNIESYIIDSDSNTFLINYDIINITRLNFDKLKIVIPSGKKVYGYCVLSW